MIRELANTVYLFLPAGVANMAPVFLTRFCGPGVPVHRRLFGDHKSWRGLIAGTAAGTAFFMLQRAIDHEDMPLRAGMAMSGGALLGDLLKSYVKRRRALPPGTSWIPFDQVDYIAGAIIGTRMVVPLTVRQMTVAAASFVLLHFAVSGAGYALGLKERAL